MLTRRVIPCLDVRDGRIVKGVQFQGLRDAGDPAERAAAYDAQGADELVILDVSATPEGRSTAIETVRRVRAALRIPLTVGGGVRRVENAGALLDALEQLPFTTIAALNGSAYGGATDLALACDLRIGLEGIEWRMPATAIGLHYYPSGLQRYIQRMGVAASKRAFLTARPFTWQQLDKLGLFEAFVTADDFDQTLQDLTQDIFALAPLAAEETKKSLNEIENGQVNQTLLRSRVTMTSQSEDFLEGRKAFAERRKPVFKGH